MGKSGKWGRFSPSWSDKKWEQTGIGKGMSNIDSYSRGKRENPREKGKIQRNLPRISSGNLGKSRWELLRALEIQPAPDSRDKAIPGGVWREKSWILVRGRKQLFLKKIWRRGKWEEPWEYPGKNSLPALHSTISSA